MKILSLAFQIFFYKGSQTSNDIYTPLIDIIQQKTNMSCGFQPYSFFSRNKYSGPSVLIGHSFGGFFALKDYLYQPENISAIILLNSHFNSRNKAIYPGIPQEKINVPVLTILGKKDDRLSLDKSIWDFYDSQDKLLSDKFYIIEDNRTHFMGLTPTITSETVRLGNIISDFIMNVDKKNFTDTRKRNTHYFDFHDILDHSIDFNWSMNVYDALAKIILCPGLWRFFHWCFFLNSKPTDYYNIQFHDDDHVYLKTRNIPVDVMISNYNKQLPAKKNNIIRLPTIGISIPIWLSYPLSVSKKKYDVMVLPINNNTIYFKFPNPYRIMGL